MMCCAKLRFIIFSWIIEPSTNYLYYEITMFFGCFIVCRWMCEA